MDEGMGVLTGASKRHAIVILLAAAVVIGACGTPQTDSRAQGPEVPGDARPVDRSPFSMVNPTTTSGPTTIPGAGPTLYLPTTIDPLTGEAAVEGELPPSQGGPSVNRDPNAPKYTVPRRTTTTTTTTSPPTTTSQPPLRWFEMPLPGAITSVCGFSRSVRSAGNLLIDPSESVPNAVAKVRVSLARYRNVAPSEIQAQITIVTDSILSIAAAVEGAGYRLNDPSVVQMIQRVRSGQGEFAAFPQSFATVSAYEKFVC